MKEIPLTQGQVALVDDEDYEWLSQWKWSAHHRKDIQTFYAVRHVRLPNGRRILDSMHRQILGLAYGDQRECDHKNHNGLDNRRRNLRVVTTQHNQFNRKAAKGYYRKPDGHYQAYIYLNGKMLSLGYFTDPASAHNAYLRAKKIYHRIPA